MEFSGKTPWDDYEEGKEKEERDHHRKRMFEKGAKIVATPKLYQSYVRYHVDEAAAHNSDALEKGESLKEPEFCTYTEFVERVNFWKEDDPEEMYMRVLQWQMGFERHREEKQKLSDFMDEMVKEMRSWLNEQDELRQHDVDEESTD